MHHQKLVVLGLIAIGKRYGLEIEEFISDNELRRWLQVGSSTIYKILKDLEKDRAIVGQREVTEKGPARKAFELTDKGRLVLEDLVKESLASDASVYSDRIAGLFFTPLIERSNARASIKNSIRALGEVEKSLMESRDERKGDYIAEAVIQYYIDVYRAEQNALKKVSDSLQQTEF